MDNQHREITGYRELDAEEIAAMNEVKHMAVLVGDLVDELAVSPADQRWVGLARDQLQLGFMALTRAIAKPTSF